ncbi:MAG: methylenetetrahydrofolate--tRNA-(uracil(54)-C(5))-methyltransferase (FADH(2)-oxidizing) TrmFO, partial [Anaerolineales bacterium]
MDGKELIIIGGGLAGCEAAWQAAQQDIAVILYEMRPVKTTGAHVSAELAELVCSNSLGSERIDRASGLLFNELKMLHSLLAQCALESKIPAGRALAVDRQKFSALVTERIQSHPNIQVVRQEITTIPNQPTIIATGPLTSPDLSSAIAQFTGNANLFFYDAIAPIVTRESIDFNIAFQGSRYEKDNQDYINCPLSKEEYELFVDELIKAERIALRGFEEDVNGGVKSGKGKYFEACLPIEVLAQRGREALAFGPMRPTGLRDPRSGKRPFAVVQLRQDNLAGTLYNIVGFQTNLTFAEQKRVFRLIPGLANAEFVRYGQMHRNTFIYSPDILTPTLQTKKRPDLFFAGQIIGVEGYLGNIASGWLAGMNAARLMKKEELIVLPRQTMLGSLIYYITHASPEDFQPMKANYGLLI